jgi:adenosylcobinamide kinase/adenosylcobinamide-phosphate guanylyltransferase
MSKEPVPLPRSVLVLGGARSGKSRIAQQIAEANGSERVYIATAQAFDAEMRSRIVQHQADRNALWRTREAPLDLPDAILSETGATRVVLVDCMTLWLSNMLLAERDLERAGEALTKAVMAAAGPLVLVSNEVGHGIVPDHPLGRVFRDAQGRLNQRMAETCHQVIFVTAGLPVVLKPAAPLDVRLA